VFAVDAQLDVDEAETALDADVEHGERPPRQQRRYQSAASESWWSSAHAGGVTLSRSGPAERDACTDFAPPSAFTACGAGCIAARRLQSSGIQAPREVDGTEHHMLAGLRRSLASTRSATRRCPLRP
jgi:hypothetical protein